MADDRPDFGQALATADAAATSDGSSPSMTEQSSPDPSAAPPTTAPGATDLTRPETPVAASSEDSGAAAEPVGPIPLERHKAILDRQRRELEDYRTKYGWAEKVDPAHLQQMASLAQRMSADPVGFAVELVQELQTQPQYEAALRSHAARVLASRRQTAPVEEPEPEPDIVVDNYKWYSAQQLAKRDAWLQRKIEAGLEAKLQPLTTLKQQWEQREQEQVQTAKAQDFAKATYQQAQQWPYFKEHQAAIAEAFKAMPPMPDEQVGTAIRDAYIQVLTQKVLPSLSSTAQQQVLTDLKRKAVASTVNPTAPAPTPTARPKTFEEAFKQFAPR